MRQNQNQKNANKSPRSEKRSGPLWDREHRSEQSCRGPSGPAEGAPGGRDRSRKKARCAAPRKKEAPRRGSRATRQEALTWKRFEAVDRSCVQSSAKPSLDLIFALQLLASRCVSERGSVRESQAELIRARRATRTSARVRRCPAARPYGGASRWVSKLQSLLAAVAFRT